MNPVEGTITRQITNSSYKAHVEWEIPKFYSIYAFADKSWDSPTFLFINEEWRLRINLKVDGDPHSWKGLYLEVRNPSSCYSVTFTFGIRHLVKPIIFGPETRMFDSNNSSHGPTKLFQRSSLKLVDGAEDFLVIYCDVVADLPATACQTSLFYNTTILCRNFRDLLLSGRKSDVTIEVRGQMFKAHKLVLEARSPVLDAMFEHDMTEKNENVIRIEDCDPDAFRNFLHCVYAGGVENVTVEKAISLFMVSHKYTVTDIVEKCAYFMEENLSVDTVCDILALANRYNETGLKKSAETFMARNINKIFSTNSWSSLMAVAGNLLLQKYS